MKQTSYDKKFKNLLTRIREANKNGITLFVIAKPQELGDTYEA